MTVGPDWKRGLPPGKYYDGMTDDFEVYFSPGGFKWHRRRTPEEREQHLQRRERAHGEYAKSGEKT